MMEKSNEIVFIIYIAGVIAGYRVLKKSFIQWVDFGDKSKWDWYGRIPCMFFCIASWASFLISFIMFAVAGGFDKDSSK